MNNIKYKTSPELIYIGLLIPAIFLNLLLSDKKILGTFFLMFILGLCFYFNYIWVEIHEDKVVFRHLINGKKRDKTISINDIKIISLIHVHTKVSSWTLILTTKENKKHAFSLNENRDKIIRFFLDKKIKFIDHSDFIKRYLK